MDECGDDEAREDEIAGCVERVEPTGSTKVEHSVLDGGAEHEHERKESRPLATRKMNTRRSLPAAGKMSAGRKEEKEGMGARLGNVRFFSMFALSLFRFQGYGIGPR
jgi:hypothetical protein